jgi:hypothetical protein
VFYNSNLQRFPHSAASNNARELKPGLALGRDTRVEYAVLAARRIVQRQEGLVHHSRW